MSGDIHDLLRKQRAALRCALGRLESFDSLAGNLARQDVDEADRLADLIQRRAADLLERGNAHE